MGDILFYFSLPPFKIQKNVWSFQYRSIFPLLVIPAHLSVAKDVSRPNARLTSIWRETGQSPARAFGPKIRGIECFCKSISSCCIYEVSLLFWEMDAGSSLTSVRLSGMTTGGVAGYKKLKDGKLFPPCFLLTISFSLPHLFMR